MAGAQALRRWSPYVDLTPVRTHIVLLRDGGIGYDQIARLSGTDGTHVREIALAVARSGNRPPIQQLRRDRAARILAVAPTPATPHS